MDDPSKDIAKAAIVGFARINCKQCFGRGRIGWDVRYSDGAHVIPCHCVEMFDLEVVQKAKEAEHKEAEQKEAEKSQETINGS